MSVRRVVGPEEICLQTRREDKKLIQSTTADIIQMENIFAANCEFLRAPAGFSHSHRVYVGWWGGKGVFGMCVLVWSVFTIN